MSNGLVSIIIPTYNRAHLIGETLLSIKNQTYDHWECYIIDDGSTDNTETIIEAFIKEDSRFTYAKRPEKHLKGPNGCRNYGIDLSKGDYIGCCDDDDLWVHDKLQKQLQVFNNNKDISLVTGNFEFVEANGERSGRTQSHKGLNHGYVFKNMLLKNRTTAITPLFKRNVLDKVGNFNEDFRIFEDWEFYLRVSYYYEFYALDDVLAYVRKHPDNTSNIVTQEPLEQYQRHKKLIDAVKVWGKKRFTKEEKRLVSKSEWQRYKQIMKNHCPGFLNKLKLLLKISSHNLGQGLSFIGLFLRYEVFKNK